MNVIEIDGGYGSGGGQILRTAITLSALTNQSVKITNIRKNRKNPGIREQHLQAINTAAALCNALHNAELYTTELTFKPNKISPPQNLSINISTAGSTALVSYVSLCIFALSSLNQKQNLEQATSTLKIQGGATWNKFAPSILYLQHILLPILKQINLKSSLHIERDGFYPQAQALVSLKVQPWKNPSSLTLDKFSMPANIEIFSTASSNLQQRKVAERQAETATKIIKENLKINPTTQIIYTSSLSTGSGILLKASSSQNEVILGSDSVGELRKKSEDVGREAASQLIREIKSQACVDRYASDMLMPFLAFAGGKIKTSQITTHAKTNAYVIEKFLPVKFNFENNCIAVEN